jgi:hypothetical protein
VIRIEIVIFGGATENDTFMVNGLCGILLGANEMVIDCDRLLTCDDDLAVYGPDSKLAIGMNNNKSTLIHL